MPKPIPTFMQAMKEQIAKLLGTAVIAAPVAGVFLGGKAIQERTRAKKTYGEIFQKFPELKNLPQDQIQDAWNVLRTYSPSLTANPVAAGSFVKKMLEYEGIEPREIKELIQTEKGYQEQKPWTAIKSLATGRI